MDMHLERETKVHYEKSTTKVQKYRLAGTERADWYLKGWMVLKGLDDTERAGWCLKDWLVLKGLDGTQRIGWY